MKVAIMQPYFFPYIGYFQLIHSVDKFIIYDDVHFPKKGWVNRNYILLNNNKHLFTIPCKSISQNKLINAIQIDKENKALKTILKTLETAYSKKAPYYEIVFPMVKNLINSDVDTISGLALESIASVCSYLGINTKLLVSSENFPETIDLGGSERMISICKTLGANELINAIGGMELYDKNDFSKQGISLSFINIKLSENQYYSQGEDQPFIPCLSIIDVMMFNSVQEIGKMLENCEFL